MLMFPNIHLFTTTCLRYLYKNAFFDDRNAILRFDCFFQLLCSFALSLFSDTLFSSCIAKKRCYFSYVG
jgi:hypothetical protein